VNGGTHAALGFASGVAALSMQETEIYEGFVLLAATFASLMPDLDEENSMIYGYTMEKVSPKMRRFLVGGLGAVCMLIAAFTFSGAFFMAGIFCLAIPFVSHRRFTHSLLALTIVTYLADSIHPDFTIPVLLGYLSHLLADSLTVSGVPWLWPITKSFRFAKLKTGGVPDYLIGYFTLFYALIAWYRM
jgi:inner membrane protein